MASEVMAAGWQERVVAFLSRLAEGESVGSLRREWEAQRDSPDLNESYIASIRLEAAQLLAETEPG